MPGPAGPFELEQNGSSSGSLPQFNLSPSGRHDSDASKYVDMEAEELDTMGEMPPVAGIGRTGTRMGPSPTRKSRLSSTTRAAGSLQKSFTAMSDSGLHGEFNTEVGRMHCDPCHCIDSWQALLTLQGMLGVPLAVSLPATLLISSLKCLEIVHGASSRYANRRPSCKVFCSQGCLPPEPWGHARCADGVQHLLAACSICVGCCRYLPDWMEGMGINVTWGRCHVSRVCSLY